MSGRPAVFLDRDGVVIDDVDLLVHADQIRIRDHAPSALAALAAAGYVLVLVTNQSVVARGLLEESDVDAVNRSVGKLLQDAGAPPFDAVYVCPHHPSAILERYRIDCECRKPRPGLLLRAADDLGLDLPASTMIGDRRSDVVAGALAGCATVLIKTDALEAPPIETSLVVVCEIVPDHVCPDIGAAVEWILGR